MIYQDIQITVNQGLAVPDKSLYIFKGDSNIILNFKVVTPQYMISKDNKDNLVTRFGVDNFELRLQLERGYDRVIRGVITKDGYCRTQLTGEVIQSLLSGVYTYQITLIDDDNNAVMTFPPCINKLNIRDRISTNAKELAVPGGLSGEAMTDLSLIAENGEVLEAFDSDGNYIKTNWSTGDIISSAKLNKIEDALDKINQNEINNKNALTEQMTSYSNRLDVVDSQLAHIEKHNKVFVNIRDFENYKIGDDWAEAINKAIEFIHTKDCFELYFPPGTYKVTKPLNSINKIGCICGNDKLDTIIEYTPSSDSTLLSITVNSNISKYFQVKNITLKCSNKDYIVNGLVCSRGAISQNLWGAGISIQDCRVLGFTGVGIKLYAPFMSNLDRVYVAGSGYKSEGDKPVGIKPIGIEFTGNENNLNTFGNVNSISDCMIANCCYGVKLVSVGNVEINTTTFEPNFINLYAYNPKGSDSTGYSDFIMINNCWFENYNNNGHSKYGAICNYEFDETTGDIKQGLSIFKKGVIYLNGTLIHPTTSNNNIDTKVIHTPSGGVLKGSLFGDLDKSDTNIPVLKYISDWGSPINIGTKSNYLHASTMFGNGTRRTYSNNNNTWLAGREATYFIEKNISSPTSLQVYTADFVIPSEFEKPEQLDIKALIGISIGGGNVMYTQSECTIFNLGNIVSGTNKTTELYNPWGDLKEIEAGFVGSKISYDNSTKTISFNIKSSATYSIQVNLELNASYLGSQIK